MRYTNWQSLPLPSSAVKLLLVHGYCWGWSGNWWSGLRLDCFFHSSSIVCSCLALRSICSGLNIGWPGLSSPCNHQKQTWPTLSCSSQVGSISYSHFGVGDSHVTPQSSTGIVHSLIFFGWIMSPSRSVSHHVIVCKSENK